MEKQLVSPEAAACTKCHRIGSGRWPDWVSRLDGTDESFRSVTTDEFLKFEKLHWMPPDLRTENITEANWADSKFAKAIDFIKSCGANRSACQWRASADGAVSASAPRPTTVVAAKKAGQPSRAATAPDGAAASRPARPAAAENSAYCVAP